MEPFFSCCKTGATFLRFDSSTVRFDPGSTFKVIKPRLGKCKNPLINPFIVLAKSWDFGYFSKPYVKEAWKNESLPSHRGRLR
jgi:hypothetical protein